MCVCVCVRVFVLFLAVCAVRVLGCVLVWLFVPGAFGLAFCAGRVRACVCVFVCSVALVVFALVFVRASQLPYL